jgi:hypothetical protein
MQEWLSRAAKELGLRVHIGHQVALSDGTTLVAQAYFPDLSNPLGILVFEWSDAVDGSARGQLRAMGMGISTFGDPGPEERFDIDSYKEMFAEWGWTGPQDRKPPWMA